VEQSTAVDPHVVPPVRYVRCGDGNVAYQRFGVGDTVQVFVPPLTSNLDLVWELEEWSRLIRRAARVLDVITYDKRGTGLSDPVTDGVGFETHAADLIAIMDREGVERAGLAGFSEGGIVALVAAALFPDRVSTVVTQGTPVMGAPRTELEPFADPADPPPTDAEQAERYRSMLRHWATAESMVLDITAPGASADPRIVEWQAKYERQSASPGAARIHLRSQAGFDLRPYLSRVRCPTLVLHATRDGLNHVTHGRLLASLLPNAELREFDHDAHFWFLTYRDAFSVQDWVEGWTLGHAPDRGTTTAFATVLFTDIVDSTRRAAELGDAAWRQLLEHHDAVVRSVVGRFDGHVVKTTGDGVLATFSDPGRALDAAGDIRTQLSGSGIAVRAGLHIGQLERREDGDVAGVVVNIAARVEAVAAPGQILVTQAIRDMMLGSGRSFEPNGDHQLKGIEGSWRLYSVRP
jgi:class 3 adenylate cyclase/pimeloyl-ACP methyl ester carboxylesterase